MGPRRAPLASIVADFGSLDAVGVDYHVCRVTVAQCATLASGFGTLLGTGGAVNRTGWSRFGGWLDQKGPPTMRRSVKVVYHAVARRLADAFQVLRPWVGGPENFAPLAALALCGAFYFQKPWNWAGPLS